MPAEKHPNRRFEVTPTANVAEKQDVYIKQATCTSVVGLDSSQAALDLSKHTRAVAEDNRFSPLPTHHALLQR